MAYCAAVVVLFSLFFHSAITTQFVAPANYHNTFQNCESLARPTTGIFFASADAWSTDVGYDLDQSAYAVRLSEFDGGSSGYKSVMQLVAAQLSERGSASVSQNLAWNLLSWSTFTYEWDYNGVLTFTTLASPDIIFDQTDYSFGIANAYGYCNYTNRGIDYSQSVLTLTLEAYLDEPFPGPCSNFFDTDQFMASSLQGDALGGDLNMKLYMRSFMVAAAVNIGMLDFSVLRSTVSNFNFVFQSLQYPSLDYRGEFNAYYDPNFIEMEPIYCFNYTYPAPEFVCFAKIQETLAYPIFNHYGFSNSSDPTSYYYDTYPDFLDLYCTCPPPAGYESDAEYCNVMDLMATYVFYPDYTEGSSYYENNYHQGLLNFSYIAQQNIKQSGNSTYEWIAGYDATQITLNPSNLYDDFSLQTQQTFGAFCDGCTILAVNAYGNAQAAKINHFSKTLINGSCHNTIYPDTFVSNMVNDAPFALDENFYQCYLTFWGASFQAAGFSLVNASVIGVLFLTLVLFCSHYYLTKVKKMNFSAFGRISWKSTADRALIKANQLSEELIQQGSDTSRRRIDQLKTIKETSDKDERLDRLISLVEALCTQMDEQPRKTKAVMDSLADSVKALKGVDGRHITVLDPRAADVSTDSDKPPRKVADRQSVGGGARSSRLASVYSVSTDTRSTNALTFSPSIDGGTGLQDMQGYEGRYRDDSRARSSSLEEGRVSLQLGTIQRNPMVSVDSTTDV